MPTYQLISANTLSSNTSTVTFSSIPQTFTDLVLKLSVRSTEGSFTNDALRMRFNGSSSSVYNETFIRGDGSGTAVANTTINNTSELVALVNTEASGQSTFSNVDIYIPNYTDTGFSQQSGAMTAMENTTTAAYITTLAGRYSPGTAISSITFAFYGTSSNFLSQSSFYLYGISNA